MSVAADPVPDQGCCLGLLIINFFLAAVMTEAWEFKVLEREGIAHLLTVYLLRVFTSLLSCVNFWPLVLEGGGGFCRGEINMAECWEE